MAEGNPWRAQTGPQLEAIQKAWIDEMLYGGAAGAGKTAFLLGDFAQDVPTAAGAAWHGILFRRTYAQLEEVIKQSLEMYPPWFDPNNEGKVEFQVSRATWKWANGATLKLRYADEENDWMEYQGHQYGWIGYDELTQWPTPTIYQRMKSRLRSADGRVKHKRIRASANPGGPGHGWVKSYFGIDHYPNGRQLLKADDGSEMVRVFIPGKVTDNKILLEHDPQYVNRLRALGSPELVRAWLDGDWSVVQGAYFPEFSYQKHVVPPVSIPESWGRIRAMDWGSAAPFAVLWAAISDGNELPCGTRFPRGALVVYREWYGAEQGSSGAWVGIKKTAEEIGEGIAKREAGEEINDYVLDPAAFANDGGPSHAERMMRTAGVVFRRGDNKRIPGWDMVRARLKGNLDGEPMLYVSAACPALIRTLPALQHDETKPEDVDTDGEDHAADALRYLCMSRPWVREDQKAKERDATRYLTLDYLWSEHDTQLRRSRSRG